MTALVWDKVGTKTYQGGVDRGVLYLPDGSAVAWSGLTSVDDAATSSVKAFYLDNVKYLDDYTPGDYSGTLKAFTYPDEFDAIGNGILSDVDGFEYHDQPIQMFNLSYRTKIGNDLDGLDHGYKIHLLYNLMANPSTVTYATLSDSLSPLEFSWALTGTPSVVPGHRPTSHVTINSLTTPPVVLNALEQILYGTALSAPSLPKISDIVTLFGALGNLIIVDHGDGTWSAIDESNSYISMVTPTEFEISGADAKYLNATTYQISDTQGTGDTPLGTIGGSTTSTTSVTPYSETILIDNPVSYYRLGDSNKSALLDEARANDTASIGISSVTAWLLLSQSLLPNGDGFSIQFQNAASGIQIPAPTPAIGSGDWSYECWMNLVTWEGKCLVFSANEANSGAVGPNDLYINVIKDANIQVASGAGVYSSNGTYVPSATPFYLAVTVGNGQVDIYVNGVLVDSGPITQGTVDMTNGWFMNLQPSGDGGSVIRLQEVAIYSYILTAAQISNHYVAAGGGS